MQKSSSLESNEFELLRNYIESFSGIHLDSNKMYLIQNRLESLMVENNCNTYSALYFKATADTTKVLQEKIIDAMTTNETLWFRDAIPFQILQNKIFPKLADLILQGKKAKIRVWSAACSTGQEPYSIAMIFQEFIRGKRDLLPEHIEIIATDISSSVLELAQNGTYDTLTMSRGLNDDMKNRYFSSTGKMSTIKNEIKKMVTFKKLNLQSDFRMLGSMDIIFCRNVLIYFSDIFKRDVLSKIASLLQPSGILFVGSSESVSNYNTDFDMISHEKGLYYQIKNKHSKK